MIYSYNKCQQDAQFLKFILVYNSTCFGQVHRPSPGVSQRCIHAIGICHASSVGCLLAWSWPRWQTAICKGEVSSSIYLLYSCCIAWWWP